MIRKRRTSSKDRDSGMNAGNVGRNANATTTALSAPLAWVTGKGFLPQIVLAVLLSVVLYITYLTIEMIYKQYAQTKGTRIDLLPLTISSESKPREFEQNPNAKNAKFLPFSDNERTGAEFSYTFYIWINPSSFRQEEGLLHIMHKGYPTPYPLMGPGVFLKSNVNTLRVYMNSSKTWNNYIDIENIPVKKWVHIAIVGRDNAIEIYINANLAKKLNMDGAVFYQNFGNLYLFNSRNISLNGTLIPSLKGESIRIFGTYNGSFSNLNYFSYAISYTELQGLVGLGPSTKTETNAEDAPPYLEDAWWVNSYSG
jgi:hypothetical protein